MILKKIKPIIACILSCIIGILLISDSNGNAVTIQRCIYVCLDSLIPSLFCFMLFSSVLIKSGIGELIAKPLWFIFKHIIKVDSKLFSVFILSQIGGYPIGVRLLSELYYEYPQYKKKYNNALAYCYNSGPAFVVGIVGIGIYNDIYAGLIVFLSCLAANTLAAVVLNIHSDIVHNGKTVFSLSSDDLSSSLISTAKAMLNIALPILLFNSVTELINFICTNLLDFQLPATILSFIEITNIKSSGTIYSIPITTAMISFGGLCVIYQIFTLSAFKVNKMLFFFSRLIIATAASMISYIIISLTGYEPTRNVFAYATDTLISNPILLLCISGMTFILLKDAGGKNKYKNF